MRLGITANTGLIDSEISGALIDDFDDEVVEFPDAIPTTLKANATHFIDAALPTNATGKILRLKLKFATNSSEEHTTVSRDLLITPFTSPDVVKEILETNERFIDNFEMRNLTSHTEQYFMCKYEILMTRP